MKAVEGSELDRLVLVLLVLMRPDGDLLLLAHACLQTSALAV